MPPLTIRLTTTGRRTGQRRTVTLYAFADGERLIVVGSRGGSARDPAWAGNLRAEPQVTVERGGDAYEARATELDEGAERDRLWRLVSEAFPLYLTYQRKTGAASRCSRWSALVRPRSVRNLARLLCYGRVRGCARSGRRG